MSLHQVGSNVNCDYEPVIGLERGVIELEESGKCVKTSSFLVLIALYALDWSSARPCYESERVNSWCEYEPVEGRWVLKLFRWYLGG